MNLYLLQLYLQQIPMDKGKRNQTIEKNFWNYLCKKFQYFTVIIIRHHYLVDMHSKIKLNVLQLHLHTLYLLQ